MRLAIKTTKLDPDFIQIPDHARESFELYFQNGFAPGGFCTAVLANDLNAAAHKADPWNRANLCDIARWIQHNAPYGSWGSYEAVEGWLSKNEHYENYQRERTFNILKEEQS